MQTYHWGVWVNSDRPVVGVVQINDVEYIHDQLDSCAVVDLRFEEGLKEHLRDRGARFVERFWRNQPEGALCEDVDPTPSPEQIAEWTEEYSEMDQPPGKLLIGDWVIFPEGSGYYVPDINGEFSAIVDYDDMVIQIVLSKWVTRGALCSPCFPGQVDLDTPGDYLGYDLPLDFYGEDDFEERNKPYDLRVVQYAITVNVVRAVGGVIQPDQIEEVYSPSGSCGDLMAIKKIAANLRDYGAMDIADANRESELQETRGYVG